MSSLNANAPEFYPMCMYAHMESLTVEDYYTEDQNYEESISSEDLEELEMVDEWVSLMAELDWEEKQHLKNVAFMHMPVAAEVLEEEARKAAAAGNAARVAAAGPKAKKNGKKPQ